MVASKIDCTGKRFGWLTVIGKKKVLTGQKRKTYTTMWVLRCDCGNVVHLLRDRFDHTERQKSCGCARSRGWIDNKRRTTDITDKRFGSLTAVKLTGKKVKGQSTWLLKCDCGGYREMALKQLNNYNKRAYGLHCNSPVHFPGAWYPPTPNPYPSEAGKIIEKYLWMTKTENFPKNKQVVEDARIERLIRVAWTIVYRRSQGEEITKEYEFNLIKSHIRYASLDVYNPSGYHSICNDKNIGKEEMTNLTSPDPRDSSCGEKPLCKKRISVNRK